MAFYRVAKTPLNVFYNIFSSIAEIRQPFSFPRTCLNPTCSFGMPFRSFSADASASAASTQMDLIKLLRERTCAPIKDVKSALVDSNWDIDAAHKDLRKRGVVLASKKSSRTAIEGLLALAQDENRAAVVELNCETDFVARNEIFQHLATSLAKLALLAESSSQKVPAAFPLGPDCFEDLKICLDHPKLSGETTVQSAITEVAAMMGENVRVRRGFMMSASPRGIVCTYLHTSPQPGLGRIAGILTLELDGVNASSDALRQAGSDLAMHVVAAKPLFLTKEDVSSGAMESERDILRFQAESTGKPPMAIEKMVEGRMRKYLEEVVLMEQKFVVQDAINVKTLLNNLSVEVGCAVKIGSFFRMEVGEGMQRLESSDGTVVAEAA